MCVIEREGDYSDFEFFLVVHQVITSSNEWILDTGCTYHMCPQKKWFFKFEEVDG